MSLNLSSLLETKWFSDLSIVVKGQTIKAHKCILAARSQVFEAMLHSKMTEAATHTIVIDDIEVDVVKAALQFIYLGTVDKTPDIYSKLLYVADKYDLEDLLKICEEKMAVELSVDNATQYLQLADLYHAQRLKATAAVFIRQNLDAVKLTDVWKVLSSDNAQLIVSAVVNKLPIEQKCDILPQFSSSVIRIVSTVEVLKGRCEWRIQNYSFLHCAKGECVSSPPFKCFGSNALEWTLDLYPQGNKDAKPDDVGFFLNLVKTSVPSVQVEAKLSIHDTRMDKVYSHQLRHTYKNEGGFGMKEFFNKSNKPLEFMYGTQKLWLEDNVMVLSCELSASLDGQIKHIANSTVDV